MAKRVQARRRKPKPTEWDRIVGIALQAAKQVRNPDMKQEAFARVLSKLLEGDGPRRKAGFTQEVGDD
jgi:hypothetical protein